MSYKHRYTVRRVTPPHPNNFDTFRVIKFDKDLNPEGSYIVSKTYAPQSPTGYRFECDCFASNKASCRHREMITIFVLNDAIDTGRQYDFDKRLWFAAPSNE